MTREKSDTHYPLHGLKVLDFSRVAGLAGRMLSDLGADVVKVEPPDGDVTRLWGRKIAGLPGYYHQQNAGKRNICMDLRAPGAVELGEILGSRSGHSHRKLSAGCDAPRGFGLRDAAGG